MRYQLSRQRLTLFSLLMLFAVFFAACATPAAPAASPASEGESAATSGPSTVRIGWKGSPDSLNPGVAVLIESYTLFFLVYDSLMIYNLDGTFSPGLAESWTTSEDGKVWTFKIRSGVKWHDGEALTAKDVAFTFNLYKATIDYPYLNAYTTNFVSAEATDDTTVVVTLDTAIPNMDAQLYSQFILPEHIWSKYSEGTGPVDFLNDEMIGSGPFKLAEYKQNEFVRLTANKEHYQSPPKVDEVVFQTFANEDALVQALQTGQADMITEMPNTAVPTLRNAENIKLAIGAPLGPGVADIIMNQTKPENCPADDGKCTGHPALLDRNVRLALAHATDKQNIIDTVLLGLGNPGLTLIPDGLGEWYNNTLKDYEFDIAKANQILDDAGYKDSDGDGVREMPDGSKPLIFRLQWPNDSVTAPRMAELLGQTWLQAGIKTEPQALDPDALTAVCCPAFDFDIMLWGWGSDPDPNLLLNVMTTEAIPTGSSETGYSNPEFDALYAEQSVTLDKAKRKDLVWKMQEIVHNDVVYVIPYYEQETQAYRTDTFKGWIDTQTKLSLVDRSSLTVIEPVK